MSRRKGAISDNDLGTRAAIGGKHVETGEVRMVPGNIEHIEDQSTTLIGSDTQRLIEAVRGSHAARVLYEHAMGHEKGSDQTIIALSDPS